MASAERSTAHQIQQQQQQQQQQQEVLRCPRCNSSNTKFCYYNNYSLSQPRHFCKACKRYWTRGGTLRNVPVGGGCRKNKRIKTTLTTFDNNPNPNSNPNLNLDHSISSNNILNPLYGLRQPNPKRPRFDTRYDHLIQPQTSSFRLGFSSSDPGDPSARAYSSLSLVSSSKLSGGITSSSYNSDHMISSLLASSLQQQPTFVDFPLYGSVVNEVQMEGPKISTNWNTSLNGENDNDQIKALESSDPTSFLWTITGGDGGSEWHDPTSNVSVPSLI